MPKYENVFIAVDTETGGLPSKLKKEPTIEVALTEIAFVSVDNETLQIKEKQSYLIKPYAEDLIYEKGAEIASGISKQMCEEQGHPIEEVHMHFKHFLESNKKGRNKPILVLHNAPFDIPFLENLFKLFNDDLYEYIECVQDTLIWARMKWIEKPKFTLGAVAEYFGLDHVQAHRALPDTIITAQVWANMVKGLRNDAVSTEKEVKFRDTFRF